jgi:aminoglycoside phosphotransferase (APT) family kinase protein
MGRFGTTHGTTHGTAGGERLGAVPGDLAAALGRLGLAGSGDVLTGRPLTGGVSSDVWLVELPDGGGRVCVKRALERLRVAGEWLVPTGRARWEDRWLRLAAEVLPDGAACRVRGFDERGPVLVLDWLDPVEHPVWKGELAAGRIDPATAAAVGARLGAVHSAAAAAHGHRLADWEPARPLFDALRIDPYLRATARVRPEAAARLAELASGLGRAAVTVIHGDVSPKNILVGPNGPILLDAECASPGDPAFDLAFCLNHLLLKGAREGADRGRYNVAFSALADSYLAGVDWESVTAIEARAAALLPALFLARVDGKSPVEYLTRESERAAVRRCAEPLVADPPSRLKDIVEAWGRAR